MEMIAGRQRGLLARRRLLLWSRIQRQNVVPVFIHAGAQAQCGEDGQQEKANALMSDRQGGWRRRWRDDRASFQRRVVDATLFSDYFADQPRTDQQIVDAGVFVSGFQ